MQWASPTYETSLNLKTSKFNFRYDWPYYATPHIGLCSSDFPGISPSPTVTPQVSPYFYPPAITTASSFMDDWRFGVSSAAVGAYDSSASFLAAETTAGDVAIPQDLSDC